jgi:hypothetical protein
MQTSSEPGKPGSPDNPASTAGAPRPGDAVWRDKIIHGDEVWGDVHLHFHAGAAAATRGPVYTAPASPADFVPRPNEYGALRQLLLSQAEGPVAISAALHGAGGFGKTTLAEALCHDPAVVAHFSSGILWLTLGQEPGDAAPRLLDLVWTLTGFRSGVTTLDVARGEFIKAVGDKKLLLVIDDVWQADHLAPFLQFQGLTFPQYSIILLNN